MNTARAFGPAVVTGFDEYVPVSSTLKLPFLKPSSQFHFRPYRIRRLPHFIDSLNGLLLTFIASRFASGLIGW